MILAALLLGAPAAGQAQSDQDAAAAIHAQADRDADTASYTQIDQVAVVALASWAVIDAATGYEQRTSPALARQLGNGWSADRWGNVVRAVGQGSPHRIVACALDAPSYAVSQITTDGYLRLHRIGRGSDHPLWDQAHEAQQVRVLTDRRPVAAVVARSNGHFAQQHRDETDVVTTDDLWVDVGAESAAEVAALGIELLHPVQRHLPVWPMEGHAAGSNMGRRAGCAAVVAVAEAAARAGVPGRTRFVLSAQEGMGWVGLGALVTRGGPVDQLTIVAPGQREREDRVRPAPDLGRVGEVIAAAGVETVRWIAPNVRRPGAMIEVIALDEAAWLRGAVAAGAGLRPDAPLRWPTAPTPRPFAERSDPDPLTRHLLELLDTHGIPDHEWAVRRYVLEHMPAWALDRAVVDDMGNVMVEAGPERDTTVFIAHMDEVGFRVAAVAPDGTVTLDRRGGAVSSAWEGQTALVRPAPAEAPSAATGDGRNTDPRWKAGSLRATTPPALRGVFLTRAAAEGKEPGPLRAWFGMDGSALAARGIQPGASVTSFKQAQYLGPHRVTARSTDDRVGTTALLMALHDVDPEALAAKVVFTWSVHEEGGLLGAGALARRYGRSAARVYSIDTFVSSDTPLESPHFAHVLLGAGPVLRAIENSSVSPPAERERVRAAAARAGIALQTGLTQGGTDGTRFTFWGAPNQGISWPGRYSHSPGEVLDLRDVRRLRALIVALAEAGGN